MGDAGAKMLAALMASGVPLRELDLAGNEVGDEGAVALGDALAGPGATPLARLDLSRCALGDPGAAALCGALAANTSLQQLSLHSNRFPFSREVLLQLAALVAARPGITVDLGTSTTRQGSTELVLDQGSSTRLLACAAASTLDSSSPCSSAVLLPPNSSVAPSAAASGEALVHGAGGCAAPSPVRQLSAAYLQRLGSGELGSRPGPGHRRGASSGGLSCASCDQCEICFDSAVAVQLRSCCHMLCVSCYQKVWQLAAGQAEAGPACPFCRVPLTGFHYLADWLEG